MLAGSFTFSLTMLDANIRPKKNPMQDSIITEAHGMVIYLSEKAKNIALQRHAKFAFLTSTLSVTGLSMRLPTAMEIQKPEELAAAMLALACRDRSMKEAVQSDMVVSVPT